MDGDPFPPPATHGRFSFEWFSGLPTYRSANLAQVEGFLSRLRVPSPWVGIDVACGVGLMSELCAEVADRLGASLRGTFMVDRDAQALAIARDHLASKPVALLQGLGQSLPLPDDLGAFVVIGNGIHNFAAEAKAAVLREAYRVMRHGAGLFFNSAFYAGTVVDGTDRFDTDTVRQVLRIARGLGGGEALSNDGSAAGKPEAARPIDAPRYARLAEEAGFTEVMAREMVVPMDQPLWEAIADYADCALGALHHRFSAEVACTAMREATRRVFEEPGFQARYPGAIEFEGRLAIPRRWLWVTAEKP